MPILIDSPTTSEGAIQPRTARIRGLQGRMSVGWITGALLAAMTAILLGAVGCGAGGYPGGDIEALSASAVTIDSGQSYSFTAREDGSPLVSWSLTCTAPACGSLSTTTGVNVVYTAPPGLTAPMTAKLTAAVTGTISSSTATITVNPDPTLAVVTATATVGAAYTGATNPTGGTAPLALTLSTGTLPPGLAFNATTGAITGTPTTTGTFNFTAQIIDSSAVPYTATQPETIVVAAAPVIAVTVVGNPPAGTVQTAYSTTFTATGGTPGYAFSLLSGSLPPGLALLSSGVLSGIPTTSGTSNFAIQAQDTVGTKGTAAFSITIAGIAPILTLSSPPVGTVGVIYSGVIGVGGGSSPYSCVITGTLPTGLTSNNCTISGTPGAAGTTSLTVTATDSSNPQGKITGPVSLVINPAPLSLTLSSLPNGTINVPYSQTIGVAGGTAPYSCTITGGTLQAGLSLSGCTVSGTPTVASTVNLTVKATDSSPTQETTVGPVSLTILPAALSLTLSSLPNGTINVPYSQTIGVAGGTAPYSCTITSGTLQAGLTLSGCTVSGTPSVASTVNLTVKATDSSPTQETTTGPVSLTINPAALTLALSSLPNGTVNVPYSQVIGVAGGTAPYSCTITSGTLQAGLTLTGCTVSGTPTVASTVNLTVKATDSSPTQETTTGPVSLTINPAALSLTLSSLPSGTINVPYSQTIGVTGGTAPYFCTITSGALQTGLTLTGCTVSGTPTVASTVNLTVKATDSSPTIETTTGPVSLTIFPAALTLTLSSLPNGTVNVPYSQIIGVAGGTAPYSCTITSGTLQAGLTLTGCTVSGTPTVASTVNLTVKATDSSPTQETTTGPVSLTINPAGLTLTLSSLPNGTVNVPYSQIIGVAGGTAPYSCTITSGTLQAGLTLSGCTVSGTPTVASTVNLTVKATDSSPTQETTTGPVSLTINPAALSLTLSSLPSGTINVPYSQTIGVTGGTAPYFCTITSGALQTGLTLTGCTVSGTPTVASTVNLTVKATDSSPTIETTTGPVSLTIFPAGLNLAISSLPNGTINVPYSQTIGVTGGTAPYSCTITSGTLQSGLTLTGCTVSGTPTVASTVNLTVKATDSSPTQETTTGPVSLTILPAPLTLTLSSLPNGTINVPYSQTIGVAGGTAPYSCTITGGTLQAGLTLTGCTVSGTPTVASTVNLTVKATDSSPTQETTTGPVSLTILPAPLTLTLSSLPNGTINVPYSQTIGVAGGTAPYSCTITGGTLQAGLTLTGCTVSGTPTVASTVNLTVKATDSSPTQETTTGPVSLTINPAALSLTLSSLPNGTINVPYSQTIGVTGGTAPYTCTITSGTLQAGLTLTGCTVSGTPTVASTVNLTVKAIDSSPTQETTTGPVSLTILPAPLTLTLSSLPSGTINVPYSQTIGVAGGTAPYTCTITAGVLQTGLTLTGCTVSGTPTVASTVNLTVKATDSSPTQETTTGPVSLTIFPAGLNLALTSLPDGTINVPYSQTIGVTGGTAPYTCTITAGTLQAGLTLNGCTVSGTPTVASTVNLTVMATDSSNPKETTTGPVSLTINPAPLKLTLSSLPDGTINVPYSQTIGVSGGTAPYSCTITGGTLQAGLTLTGCTVSGTPTVASTVHLTVKATDSSPTQETTTGPVSLTINPAPLMLTLSSLPDGTINVPYSQTIGVSGGTAPYSCTITGGTLQAGLTLTGCTVSGTPTVASTVHLTVKATDSSPTQETTTGPVSLTINPAPLMLTLSSLPDGTINVPYSQTIGVSGGTAPYSCTITGGTLQAGLTLTGCTVSGTPTVASTVHLTVKATDSSPTQETTTGPVSLTISPAPLMLTLSSLPDGTINVPYSQTIGVSGGTAPYSCTITGGTLQAGLTLTGCTVSGTPTVASTVHLTVKATDSSPTQETTTGPVSLTINPAPLMLTLSSLPDGTVNVPYSQTIGVSGGTAPYSCTIVSGTLQQGLSLTGCTVSGTPTVASTVNLMVKATDSSPTQETTTGPVSLTINPAPLTLTLSSLPDGTINKPYSAVIGVAGGTAPYTCTITAGILQAGLTLTGCTVSGTPTVASTVNLTVKATDSSNPQETTTGPVSLTINPAALTLTLSSLPDGTVGTPYNATIGVSGGTAPYTCTITAGTLQAGLSLTGCTVSGTPTVAATAHLTVKATDSSPTQETTTGPVSLTINPAAPVIVITSPPAGTVNVPYMGPIGITGGTGPYTCMITATLPPGLSLSGCTIVGTPTSPGSTTVTVTVTDSSNPPATKTGPITIVINPPTATLTLSNPPPATVDTPYTGTIGVSGGTGPYTCVLNSGTVPPGLTLTNCTLTGTPTTPGPTVLNITATDSSTPTPATTTGNVTVTVNPLATLTLNGSLPNATVGVFYTQTITAQGGLPPYTYTITAGTLPQGITLDPTTGVFSGTPTAADVGATSFTETVTDSEGPKQTASLPLVLLVVYPTTANDGELDGPYAYLFQGYDDVVSGVFAYQTATAGSFTADGMGGISLGELDANHQSSDPQGNTISSQNFLGTYSIGIDNRGLLTITMLNPDGTTGHTTTYAIAVQAPIAPATISVAGSLIESDDDQAVGTKGSGTFLAQTAAAFTAGLNGSYAFGVSGDTPCLPSCTIGIIAGPVATVGQFTTDSAGAITSGLSDTNIATTTISNSDLGGTYSTADSNGRVQLSLTTDDTTGDSYPTDYAVYIVDANRAFILSTDKHSHYILLAGSAELQTQSTFTDTDMSAPFVGYENSQTNPGLVGTMLQYVLNFSTATIFRGTGVTGQLGKCDITNVDTGGLTGLLNGVTGLVGNLTGLAKVLGGADYTGDTSCVATNTTNTTGRGVLAYPKGGLLDAAFPPPAPRVYYLSSPETGYFLETSYAGLGKLEAQTGAPFSEANTFTGTYVYGMAPASSLASIDSSGIIVSNGAGEATTTLDENVGVGTLNVIELGLTSMQSYTAPDSISGRFTLGASDVIYAITPNRFVLLDINLTATSPSVAVLY